MDNLPLLSLVTYSPLVGAAILFFWGGASPRVARWIALLASSVSFVLSVVMLVAFDPREPSLQFTETFEWLPELGIAYRLGVDGISAPLVGLTTLLTVIAVLASWDPIRHRVREYYITLLLLATGMLGVFVSLDLFLFYVFWEIVLIPMALIIGVWGSANRVYAAVKFFLYTLAGSLLMLVGIVALYQEYFRQTGIRTLDVVQLAQGQYSETFQFWTFLAFFLAFAIKVPMWPFHTWLPDAHVEAPTAGSVILAGVLLKMGGYGFLRFNLPLFPDATRLWAPSIVVLSVIAILYGALMALVQQDFKKLVAYSSVSHMGFVTLGIFALNQPGLSGAMVVMLSHGFVTSALFLIVGVLYERAHTRDLAAFGGLARNMPVFAAFFGLFSLASLGLPGLSGFVGEFLALLGGFRAYRWAGVLGTAVVILAAWYMLRVYQRVALVRAPGEPPDPDDPERRLALAPGLPPIAGGSDGPHAYPDPRTFPDLTWREAVTLLPLALLTIWVGVYPLPLLEVLEPALAALVAHGT
ncbi:complex I subunit 4 family protein [Thermomicrobium sp.]